MAIVNYNSRIYVIPWSVVKKLCKAENGNVQDVTYCVNKNRVTFTVVFGGKCVVMVFDANTGNYEYIVEGEDIIKATCNGKRVVAVSGVSDGKNADIFSCISEINSGKWEYKDLGFKKPINESYSEDYHLVAAGDDVIIKVDNPLSEVEYIKYASDNYSVYSLYEYWRGKDINADEGSLGKDSINIELSTGADLSHKTVTFCNNPRFAAGYLKYIVLGDALYMMLLTDTECDELLLKNMMELEKGYTADTDYLIESFVKNYSNRSSVVSLFEDMAEACDVVFTEKTDEAAIQFLKIACSLFNESFEKYIYPKTGYRYRFNLYFGEEEYKKRRKDYGDI